MNKNATPDKRVQEIVELVSTMVSDEVRFSLLGTIAVMNRRYIGEDTKNLIWEAMKLTAVFEKQLKILDEKRRIEDLKAALHELYTEEGISEEDIKGEERGIKRVARVSERTFQEIKEQVKKELTVQA